MFGWRKVQEDREEGYEKGRVRRGVQSSGTLACLQRLPTKGPLCLPCKVQRGAQSWSPTFGTKQSVYCWCRFEAFHCVVRHRHCSLLKWKSRTNVQLQKKWVWRQWRQAPAGLLKKDHMKQNSHLIGMWIRKQLPSKFHRKRRSAGGSWPLPTALGELCSTFCITVRCRLELYLFPILRLMSLQDI